MLLHVLLHVLLRVLLHVLLRVLLHVLLYVITRVTTRDYTWLLHVLLRGITRDYTWLHVLLRVITGSVVVLGFTLIFHPIELIGSLLITAGIGDSEKDYTLLWHYAVN